MNIQDIKSNTTWQEASNTINNNNNKISLAIATLENATLKNKGYFTSVEKLNEAIPNPTIGSKAYVGTSEPYAIYIVENGAWVDSGYTGGNEIVANITTDRIENGAVTSEKISSSAFDNTLSISGKIAPADIVGGKITYLEEKVDALALGEFYGYFPDSASLPTDVATSGYAYVGTDNPYEIWNFNGESWSDSGTSIDMNDADEEDITRNTDGKLQFKDRSYGDGMGYVIIRNDKTFAEQVTKENTIYEIRYDCALPTNKFTMPSNTILRFNGGKLMNGTIVGDRTSVEAIANAHIFKNVVFEGVWDIVGGVYPEWFGAKSGKDVTGLNNYWRVSVPPSSASLPDASSAINSAIALAAISESVCRLYGGVYRIEHTIEVLPMCTIEVSSRTIIVPYMNGEGTDDNGNKVLALFPDSFIRQSKMCVALKCGTEFTKVIGGGKIVLGASTYTIGLLVDCPGYSNVDVSYYPEIDIKVFGGEASGIIPSYETIIGNANPDASIGEDGDTYYNATSKQLFEKKNGSWSGKASVACRYNTAYRIEGRGRETGTDNRIIATDYKFNGGFAFRGIEIIMTGSAWGNSSTIKGTLQGVSSGYVTILGQTNDIDMSKMVIQGGGAMMRCNYYYYADRVKASQFGLVWDSDNDSTGYDRWFFGEATQFNLVYSGNPHRTDLGDRNYFIPWGYIARHFAEQESSSGKGGEVKDLPLQPTLGECFYWTTEAKPIWFNGEFWTDILGDDVFAIDFADSRVYDILLASKDKNGDGKIDKRDLALLNNADFFSKLFGNNAQIEYFNEFKHCTGVDTLSGTSSSIYAFAKCSNLKEISLPTSLQTIGECSFVSCSSLTKISGGENVTYIGAQAFRHSTNLVDIGRIGENVREIRNINAFGGTKLTDMVVNFPKLEGAAPSFSYTEIKEIRSLGNATSFAKTEHCPNLVSVRLPATLTKMAEYGLQFNSVLEKVIFEGETPPTFSKQFLWRSDKAIIYVPDSAVDAYNGVISQYSSRIKPMSELV